jgi:hypothetical protein
MHRERRRSLLLITKLNVHLSCANKFSQFTTRRSRLPILNNGFTQVLSTLLLITRTEGLVMFPITFLAISWTAHGKMTAAISQPFGDALHNSRIPNEVLLLLTWVQSRYHPTQGSWLYSRRHTFHWPWKFSLGKQGSQQWVHSTRPIQA